MHVTRFEDAKPYETRGHFNMVGLRLQGYEASPAEKMWLGLSHFLPDGGAGSSDSPLEKIYVCTEGAITIVTNTGEETLYPMDSCYLKGGERREIINRTTRPAAMLVIMPYPD